MPKATIAAYNSQSSFYLEGLSCPRHLYLETAAAEPHQEAKPRLARHSLSRSLHGQGSKIRGGFRRVSPPLRTSAPQHHESGFFFFFFSFLLILSKYDFEGLRVESQECIASDLRHRRTPTGPHFFFLPQRRSIHLGASHLPQLLLLRLAPAHGSVIRDLPHLYSIFHSAPALIQAGRHLQLQFSNLTLFLTFTPRRLLDRRPFGRHHL